MIVALMETLCGIFVWADLRCADPRAWSGPWPSPTSPRMIARHTVEETQLGNYDGKYLKIFRKTRAALMDIIDDKSVGVIEELSRARTSSSSPSRSA